MIEAAPRFPRSLFVFSLLYGGMTVLAGIVGAKQVTLGPLVVEAGIFPFLILVVLSSAVAELHGKATADQLVRFGFIPLVTAIGMTAFVLSLPTDPSMYEPAKEAFPIILGQGARLMVAGIFAYGVSMTMNVLLFSKLSGNGEGRMIAVRGAVASSISQAIDTVIFITIAFLGVRPILDLMVTQGIAKITLSVLVVPIVITLFVKLGRWLDRSST